MLRVYVQAGGRVELRQYDDPDSEVVEGLWYDLIEPTPAEIKAVEKRLGLELPQRAEMQEIEISSRLYQDGDALFITATVMSQVSAGRPASDAVTFVVMPSTLVTLRYSQPLAFTNFAAWLQRSSGCPSDLAFLGLMEAIVDRAADVLERIATQIDQIAVTVFEPEDARQSQNEALKEALKGIGRHGTLISSISDSLLSISRAEAFFGTTAQGWLHKEAKTRVKTLGRDIRSLHDHAAFLSQKVNFMLDAVLGMINIEQNNIIKIFSVAAVAFLPPTLIASIYGMNFKDFPELNWTYGYPFAIALMILSAALPFTYFKRRGWL